MTFQIGSILACATFVCFLVWRLDVRRKSFAAQCASNLTSCSLAALIHAQDHEVDSYAISLIGMSNQLITPKVLICPTERNDPNRIWNGPWWQITTNNIDRKST